MKCTKADDIKTERELAIKKLQEEYSSKTNLVYYMEFFKINSLMCIIMEYFEKGDLGKYLDSHKQFKEEVK
jgi:serine/threonine protein kinase